MILRCQQPMSIVVSPPASPMVWFYWTLDENAGPVRTDSNHGEQLGVFGDTGFGTGPAWVGVSPGLFSNCVHLYGAPGGTVQAFVGNGAIGSGGAITFFPGHSALGFSFCFWLKIISRGAMFGRISYNCFGVNEELALSFTDTVFQFIPKDRGQVQSEFIFPALPALGTWTFVHMFYDSVLAKMGISFDNGAPQYTSFTPNTLPVGAGTPADIGTIGFYQYGFGLGTPCEWLADEALVRVDDCLSAAQLAYLYNGGAGRTWPIVLP